MEEFYIGQVFEGVYPPEAAVWCNENNAHIEEVEGGYIIVENPSQPETKTVRTFSKFAIWVATRNLPVAEGSDVMVWDAFESFLHENKLWSGWNQLVDLVEDNMFFEQFYPVAVEAFGKGLVDGVLEASVSKIENKIKEG